MYEVKNESFEILRGNVLEIITIVGVSLQEARRKIDTARFLIGIITFESF